MSYTERSLVRCFNVKIDLSGELTERLGTMRTQSKVLVLLKQENKLVLGGQFQSVTLADLMGRVGTHAYGCLAQKN